MQQSPCPVCGKQMTRMLFRPWASPGPVVRCQNCDMIYVTPVDPHYLIGEGPVLWAANAALLTSKDLRDLENCPQREVIERYQVEHEAKEANAVRALDRIERIHRLPGRLLDFGCFTGHFLAVAARRGWDVQGLEPMAGPAIYARGVFGLPVTTDTLHDETFPADHFDVVTAFQVFEHLSDPVKELCMISRILRPQGLVVIEVPCLEGLPARLLGPHHRHFVKDHVSFFSQRTLAMLLGHCGFRVVDCFHPARILSIRSLAWWVRRMVFRQYLEGLDSSLPQSRVMEGLISVNLRDILCIIGRKIIK